MHLLFIDESGTPPKPGITQQRYFVVGGAIIPEKVWHQLRDAIQGMKTRRKVRGGIKWRYFAPNNNDDKNPMRAFSQAQKDEVRDEFYSIITGIRAIRTMAVVCSVTAAYKMQSVSDQSGVYHLSYKTISERFQYYLQDLKRDYGIHELGIIIGDHRNSQEDTSLRSHHQKLLHSSGSNISKYNNLIESLLLQHSNLSVGIQCADMVAGAVWRKFEKNDSTWYDKLEPSLRRGPQNQIDGFGIAKTPKTNWV